MAISPIFQNVAQTATPANTAAAPADPRAGIKMSAEDQVRSLFLRDLNRLPDPAGQTFWEQRAKEVPPAQLNAEFREAAKAENPQAGSLPTPYGRATLPGQSTYTERNKSFLEVVAPVVIPAIAIFAPTLLPSIGSALGATTTVGANALGSAVVNAGMAAVQGESGAGILRAAAAGGAGGAASTLAGQAVAGAQAAGTLPGAGTIAGRALEAGARGAAGTGAGTLVQTGDVGKSLQAAGVGGLAGGAGELASVAGQRVLPADVSRTTQALVAGGLGGATEAAIEGANPITGALGSALQTARITSAQDAEAARRADEIRRQQVISAFEQPTTPGVGTQLGLATAGVDIAYYESDGRLRIITDATPEEIALAPSNASFITTEGGQITRSEAAASVKPSNVVGTKALFGLGTPDPSSPYAAAFGGSTGALNPGWYAMLAVDGNVPPATVIQELETFKTPANKDIVDAAINKVKDVQITAVINKTTPQDVVRNIYVEDLNNAKNVVAEANRAVNLTAGGAVEGATGVSGEAGGRLGLTDTTPSTQTTTTGASTDTSLISPVLSTIRTPEIVVGRGVGSAAGTGTTGSRDQNILDLTGIRTEVGGTQTDTTGTGAASGAGAGAATGTGTGAGVTGDGSGAGVSGFGPGAGGTGTGTGRGVGAGEGEGGGTPGKTEDETKKITEDTLTPIITRPPIIDDPTRIIDYRYFNVVDPTFSAPPLTTTTMAPGSSALAQALGVGDPGVSYLSKKGKERKPVWNVESLKLSDELGGNYG